jgi:hypothetical protein
MRDSRKTRDMVIIGLSAAIGAILGEHLIKPTVRKTVRK